MTTLSVSPPRRDAGAWSGLEILGADDDLLGVPGFRDTGSWSLLEILGGRVERPRDSRREGRPSEWARLVHARPVAGAWSVLNSRRE